MFILVDNATSSILTAAMDELNIGVADVGQTIYEITDGTTIDDLLNESYEGVISHTYNGVSISYVPPADIIGQDALDKLTVEANTLRDSECGPYGSVMAYNQLDATQQSELTAYYNALSTMAADNPLASYEWVTSANNGGGNGEDVNGYQWVNVTWPTKPSWM